MDGLDAEGYDRTYDDRALVRRVVGYFAPHRRRRAGIALFAGAASLRDLSLPGVIGRGIGRLGDDRSVSRVVWLAVAILVAGVLAWCANLVRQWYTARVVGDVVLRLRLDAFRAVVARDLSFYDEFPSGKTVSRVTSDTEDFASVVTLTLDLFSQLMVVVGLGV